jgi:hypothetical protein
MKSKKITDADISEMKISSLPTRPTYPQAFGGRGYTASDMKEAFDKLPLYIIECFNRLIEDITGEGGESVSDSIKTGINETHTLSDLFSDIISGAFIMYAAGPDGKLGEYLLNLRTDVDTIAEKIKLNL